MSVFDQLIGQEASVKILKQAAQAGREITAEIQDGGEASAEKLRLLPHAWLITGPPGSGRSNAATALAAALQCDGEELGCGQCHACQTALKGAHPDVRRVATEKVSLLIDEVRELVSWSGQSPLNNKWRIVLIEDADRMAERTSNVLLKSIEEPPPRTLWLLCAPSPQDIIPTIRSRCRSLTLQIPPVQAVADLLVNRDGIDPEVALQAARAAQSHIGIARRLATDEGARHRRQQVLLAPLRVDSVSEAVFAAEELVKLAREEAEQRNAERDTRERDELERILGADSGEKRKPSYIQAQLKRLEEDQKRRNSRTLLDVLDRALVDLLSLYRDVYLRQVGSETDPINSDLRDMITDLAAASSLVQTVARMEAIEEARQRLRMNVTPELALEAMAIALRPQAFR